MSDVRFTTPDVDWMYRPTQSGIRLSILNVADIVLGFGASSVRRVVDAVAPVWDVFASRMETVQMMSDVCGRLVVVADVTRTM
jgi:hypothetical protein